MKNNYTNPFVLLVLIFSFSCFAKSDFRTPLTAVAVVLQPISCALNSAGTINIYASGGTGSYLFSLSDSNGTIIVNYQASGTFFIIQPGTYTFTVKDADNNTYSDIITMTAPPPLFNSIYVNGSTINCYANGGTPPYQYGLDPGNPVIFQFSNVFSGLSPGIYQVIVQDANGCTFTQTVIVENNLNVTATSTYVDFNNDGFTNVGDIINYAFTVNNSYPNTPIDNIYITSSNCTISGAAIPTLSANTTDYSNFTGTHTITQSEINAGLVVMNATGTGYIVGGPVGSMQITSTVAKDTVLPIADGIRLIAFVDTNANNIQDAGEPIYTQGNFNYQLNGGAPINTWGNTSNGYVIYENNAANIFNLNFVNNNTLAFNLVTASYTNVSVAAGSGITTYYFPLTANSFTDAAVSLYNYSFPPRPGFTYLNRVYFQNSGSQNIPAGTVTFTKDSNLTILSTNPPTTATATGFTYDFTNLAAGTDGFIDVTMQVPTIPTISLGTNVINAASIAVAADALAANNNASLTQTVVGSYDPNDKTESHGEKILFSSFNANEYLNYTIQFENTGTANAVNVRVTDVLDARLDETSIRMVKASNSNVVKRVGNTVTWNFDAIELPPSVANTQIGHGFINFKIKPKAGFAVGDIIVNKANIYFDFNPAIITNECKTEFVAALSNNDFAFNDFSFYPNPVSNILSVSNNSIIDSVNISSVLGQNVLTSKINDFQSTIDLSTLTSGVYIAEFLSNGAAKRIKIVKE